MKYNFNLFFLIQTFINTLVPQILFKISIKTIFILPDKKSLILVEGLLNIYQIKNIPQKWCWQLWYCRWETKECVVPHSRHPLGLRCLLVSQALKFTKKINFLNTIRPLFIICWAPIFVVLCWLKKPKIKCSLNSEQWK